MCVTRDLPRDCVLSRTGSDDWEWFFSKCVEAYDRLTRLEMVVLGDGAAAIKRGMTETMPRGHYVYCAKHRARNASRRFRDTGILDELYNLWTVIAYSTSPVQVQAALAETRVLSEDAYEYYTQRPREESWRSYLPLCTGGCVVSNDAG